MKRCKDCGMPMLAPEDFAGGDPGSELCVHCGQKQRMAGMVIAFSIFTARLGKADELVEFLEKNLEQARGFAGVADAYIAQSRENPAQFFTYAKWRSLEDYDSMQRAYQESPEMKQSFADIMHLLECEPTMSSFQVLE